MSVIWEKCTKCGGRVAPWSKDPVCSKCREKAYNTSPYVGRRQGRKLKRKSERQHRCKMPKCRRVFTLEDNQDPQYTWYCPTCRKQVAEITTGVLWLSNLGIEIGPEDEILMGSVADAYEEDEHETLLLQAERQGGRPGVPVPTEAAGGQPEEGQAEGHGLRPGHPGDQVADAPPADRDGSLVPPAGGGEAGPAPGS